jgi:hypothetical protein
MIGRALGFTAGLAGLLLIAWLSIPGVTGTDTLGTAAARAIVAVGLICAAVATGAVFALYGLGRLAARPARWVGAGLIVLAWRWWARLRYPAVVTARVPVPGADHAAAMDAEFDQLVSLLADSYVFEEAPDEG